MNRASRIQSLFVAACDIDTSRRSKWLEKHCQDDPQLRDEVQELLCFHDKTSLPIDSPVREFPNGDTLSFEDTSSKSMIEIPGYSIGPKIGDGGQAIVFQAIQESTEQRVAVKLFRQELMAGEKEQRRQKQEIDILAKLDHPHIIGLIDSGRIENNMHGLGGDYIVTPFVEGLPIDKYTTHILRPKSDAYPSEILELFLKVCNAVAAAHRNGIVHRDLKPANILVDINKEPRILDFGIAKSLHRPDVRKGMTLDGEFLGTVLWMSPEQAAGENHRIGPWTDTYALGVILYQLLTNELPFEIIDNFRKQLDIVLHARFEPPSQQLLRLEERQQSPSENNPAYRQASLLNEAADAITMKALNKSIEGRYQNAAEFANDVKAYLRARPTSATPVVNSPPMPLPPRRSIGARISRAFRLATIYLVLIATVGMAALLIGSHLSKSIRNRLADSSATTESSSGMVAEGVSQQTSMTQGAPPPNNDVSDPLGNETSSPNIVPEDAEQTNESEGGKTEFVAETEQGDAEPGVADKDRQVDQSEVKNGDVAEVEAEEGKEEETEVAQDLATPSKPVRNEEDDKPRAQRRELNTASNGKLGFGEPAYDDWVYTVREDGRLRIGLDNLMPLGTKDADFSSFLIDGEEVGYPPAPGRARRWSDFRAVKRGQEIKIQVKATSRHNVDYRIEPEFETLAESGVADGDASGALVETSEGTLGFGQPALDDWVFTAPTDGIVRIGLDNLLPTGTDKSELSSFLIDGEEVGYPPQAGGARRWSEFKSVRSGQEVKIQVKAPFNHNVKYRLEPDFKSVKDFGLSVSETSGEFAKISTGSLGFGQPAFDEWVFKAEKDGRLRVCVQNLMPEHTQKSDFSSFLFDGAEVGYPPAPSGPPRWSDFQSVKAGEEIKIKLAAPAGHNIIYRVEPEFESLEDCGLTVSDASGAFDGSAEGTLGFGQASADDWIFTAKEDGRVRVCLHNLMPERTEKADFSSFMFDGVRVGYPPSPGGAPRWSDFKSVKAGETVKISVKALSDHNLIYLIEPEFEAE